MQINAYLTFNGNCAEAFKFYETCLGGKIEALMTHADVPQDAQMSPEWRNLIMHARLNVEGGILMGSDSPASHFRPAQGITVSLQIPSVAQAERVFAELSKGGTVTMPIQQTFWATRFGMVTDRFGTPWMVNCETA